MKILDKITLVLFSIVILIISIIVCLTIFGWIDGTMIYVLLSHGLANKTACNIILGIGILFILLALKEIFFSSSNKDKENYNDGILLENEDGKLLITKETLVSMVDAVVSGFESVRCSQTKVYLDNENNLSIVLTIETASNTIIKELSNNLQIRIKEKIKESLDLEVKSINIKVKDIVVPKKEETKD